jgi:uncharacterized protein YdeI (YjbR/CyaY-like superfamily)
MAANALDVKPKFFRTPEHFRRWLEQHHNVVDELWVGFHKKDSGRQSITWPESVDEALCVGWIDGLRKSIDEHSYMIRFTRRKPGSIWSAVNTRRVAELIKAGRMKPAGLRTFEERDPRKTNLYSFEQRHAATFDPMLEKRFRANAKAWKFFQAQPDGYRRVATFYVMSAKQPETRMRRLDQLIDDSAAGLRIGPLRRKPAP